MYQIHVYKSYTYVSARRRVAAEACVYIRIEIYNKDIYSKLYAYV